MDIPQEDEIVKPGSKVQVDFTLADAEHASIQTDKNSFDVVAGLGQLLPQIEATLMGLRIGESRTLELKAHEAFGERDPGKIVEFDRDEFPEDVAAGDHFEAEQEGGSIIVLRVMEVLPDGVVIDLNHPLAGQSVFLTFTVREVRPATQIELDATSIQEKQTEVSKLDALLSPQSLLRGRNER